MSVEDRFVNFSESWNSPPRGRVAVTPSDFTNLPFVTTALYVTGAGNLRVVCADGSEVTFAAAAAKEIKGQFTRVMTTGTTATGIFAIK